ncbi:MAG: hypothetical protein GY851_22785, partial [bacterium]|nr:hypothetical protein [bacterium]
TIGGSGGATLLGATLGGIWTWFKSSEWWERRKNRRAKRAMIALEAGVETAHQTYSRAIREAREDGTLTADEERNARRLAREAATEYARREGIDVLSALGEDYVDLWIAKLTRRLNKD